MKVTIEIFKELQNNIKGLNPTSIISIVFDTIGIENIALASSMGIEDQVLTEMVLDINPNARIFTIDTGRLPQETYSLMDRTSMKYGFNYEVLFPDSKKVQDLVKQGGMNLFYESIEKRKLCCKVRKVDLLNSMISGLDCWITGLRKEQSVTRTNISILEWDSSTSLLKLNPLADWTEEQVWEYIKKKGIPYNKLYDKGYTSIGCAPCTRAIAKGEDVRAGRWWWEEPQHKECGLHVRE